MHDPTTPLKIFMQDPQKMRRRCRYFHVEGACTQIRGQAWKLGSLKWSESLFHCLIILVSISLSHNLPYDGCGLSIGVEWVNLYESRRWQARTVKVVDDSVSLPSWFFCYQRKKKNLSSTLWEALHNLLIIGSELLALIGFFMLRLVGIIPSSRQQWLNRRWFLWLARFSCNFSSWRSSLKHSCPKLSRINAIKFIVSPLTEKMLVHIFSTDMHS